jgi:hypothetical protein
VGGKKPVEIGSKKSSILKEKLILHLKIDTDIIILFEFVCKKSLGALDL